MPKLLQTDPFASVEVHAPHTDVQQATSDARGIVRDPRGRALRADLFEIVEERK